MPILFASRETYYEHDGVSLHTMHASGVGDLRVVGNTWLLDPETHRDGNVSFGIGVNAPIGRKNAQDLSFRPAGAVKRPVDPAIQPADGGWGIMLAGQAFGTIAHNTSFYAQAVYLLNPREMNGVQSPFGDDPALTGGDIGYTIDSVPDQYVARGGITQAIGSGTGVAVTFGARIDGVPAHDLIGGSDGYRLPGYAISIEPGFSVTKGKNSFTFTVPVAVKRHASKSVADLRTGNPIGGIATLADYVITVSYSRRF